MCLTDQNRTFHLKRKKKNKKKKKTEKQKANVLGKVKNPQTKTPPSWVTSQTHSAI